MAKSSSPPAKAGSTFKKTKSTKGGAQATILDLLAVSYSRGEDSMPKDRLIVQSKLAAKTVNNNIPKLRKEGLIEECPDSKSLRLTEEGIEFMGDKAKRMTQEEKVESIKEGLKGNQLKLFEYLRDGKVHLKEDAALALGFEQGAKQKTFVNLIGKMRSLKILDYPDKKSLKLCDAYII